MTNAYIVDKKNAMLKANDCKIYFTNPKTLQDEEVDVSKMIKVYVNNSKNNKGNVNE